MINLFKQEEKPELLCAVKPRIMEMELCILKGLNWDLRQVTALCFAPCFALKFGSTHGFNRRTINEIIIHSQQSKLDGFVYNYALSGNKKNNIS